MCSSDLSFQTRRGVSDTFTFVVQADPHLDDNSSTAVYQQALLNELADQPDFLVDLGDTSMAEKCVIGTSSLCAPPSPPSESAVRARTELARRWFETVGHSLPLFLVLGNHDGESGWVANPSSLKPGSSMPGYALKESYLDAIAAYLATLK